MCSWSAASRCITGKIAEMRTGEGKTLVATLPAYLNALAGNGVHIVTVNDYLAQRDSDWMGRIYRFLGHDRGRQSCRRWRHSLKQRMAYRGRHHLRHQQRIRFRLPARQHGDTSCRRSAASVVSAIAIVDEVDSILIDEARTPLIISGQAEDTHGPICADEFEVAPQLLAKQEADEKAEGDLLGR